MKTVARVSAIAIVTVGLTAGTAFAQQTAAQPDLTAAQIIEKLEALGYTDIQDLEKDDGVWEVEATNADGVRMDLDLDLKNGRIVKEEKDD